jgi:hypothetical protein
MCVYIKAGMLVMSVLWGSVSPQTLQQVMCFLEEDLENMKTGSLNTTAVTQFAKLGSRGEHPNNVWRDLKACLPVPRIPKLHWMFLPLKHNVLGRFSRYAPLILPHELLSGIYHAYPVMFDKLFCPSVAICREFWKSVQHSKQLMS